MHDSLDLTAACRRDGNVHFSSERAKYSAPVGVLTCVWIAFVAAVSFLPVHLKQNLHTQGRYHLLGHWLAFFITAFLLVNTARSARTRLVLLTMALVLGYGIEITQHLLFSIELEWTDMLMDTIGIVTGAMLAYVLERLVSPRQFD